jgi:hypothetical protein
MMKFSVALPGYEGCSGWNSSTGTANQPVVKIEIPIILQNPAVPCSLFDIL